MVSGPGIVQAWVLLHGWMIGRPSTSRWACVVATMLVGTTAGSPAAAQVAPFTDEAIERGLVYPMAPYPPGYGYVGFGCGFADLSGSGMPDVILIGNVPRTVGIFENIGGTFVNRSAQSGIPVLPQGSGFAVGDYDGDGMLDIYFTQIVQPNQLLRNLGNFEFEDRTIFAGVGDQGVTKGCAFGDFDLDGWLDLFAVNYFNGAPGAQYHRHRLYRNNGDGTFTDVAPAMGLDLSTYGFMVAWTDIDDDGDLDLYLVNDRGHLPPAFQGNILWRNDRGTLVDISAGSGADVQLFGMGLAVGDFNGNGFTDFYITNIAVNQAPIYGINPLLLNQGDNTFIESAGPWGVGSFVTSWGSIFFDFMNNGWLDLYVNNMFAPNRLWANDGTAPAIDVTAAAGVAATSGAGIVYYCAAVADVNGDGTMDLLVNNLGGNVQLFMNHEGASRNWVRLRLEGEHPNPHAIGGNGRILAGGRWQYREVLSGTNGYLGQNELVLHFGLDRVSVVDEAIVHWPGRTATRTFSQMPVNTEWTIHPPSRLGDHDGDGTVNLDDFWTLVDALGDPVVPGLEMMDFDGDFVLSVSDVLGFLERWEAEHGPLADCDGDGMSDLLQIALNPSLDLDRDGTLDACAAPTNNADLNGDGVVDAADLGILLGAWGARGPGDIDGNGIVDSADLGLLLAAWTVVTGP